MRSGRQVWRAHDDVPGWRSPEGRTRQEVVMLKAEREALLALGLACACSACGGRGSSVGRVHATPPFGTTTLDGAEKSVWGCAWCDTTGLREEEAE